MMTLQPPDDALDIENEYSSVYQTMYAMAYIEQDDSEAYNAEELSLEVV